ncbi:MAG: 50S ribosomal protein L21 [Candidatus Rokubacteria bacterium]|nr:50S ribosomal protein L21 [Candidatus Rokubacteria bacterium]
MEAVIEVGGKQYRVVPGQVIRVERLPETEGGSVEFRQVLMANRDGQLTVGARALANAKVVGEVVRHGKGAKLTVVKLKRRKNYRRKRGHRQPFTSVRITQIEV